MDFSRTQEVGDHTCEPKAYEIVKTPEKWGKVKDTGVPVAHLQALTPRLFDLSKIHPHPQIKKIFETRIKSVEKNEIDFATAECFAFTTLLEEGFGVRLSGQDVERGTFSHRHAVVHDQTNGSTLRSVDSALGPQSNFTVTNSHLSEYGVLGFEYGYDIANPNSLVLWEAQFGDFANTA